MAGKRSFKVVRFEHSGDATNQTQIVEVPEGGAAGLYSVFMRRVSGSGDGHIENIYGCFDSAGDSEYLIGASYSNWTDDVSLIRDNEANRFPYLKFILDFDADVSETIVELYISAY